MLIIRVNCFSLLRRRTFASKQARPLAQAAFGLMGFRAVGLKVLRFKV